MTKLNDDDFSFYTNIPFIEMNEWLVLIEYYMHNNDNCEDSSDRVMHLEVDTFTNLCIKWDVNLEDFLQKIEIMNKDQASATISAAEWYWKSLTPQSHLERLIKYGKINKENLELKSIASTHTESAPIGM